MEVDFLKKRLALYVFAALFLAATIAAVMFVQAQTEPTPMPTQDEPSSTTYVTFGYGAAVYFEVPNGVPHRPSNIRISVSHVNPESDYGAADVLQLAVWVPQLNQYVGVAILSTNPDEAAVDWIKSVVNGTPIWMPPAMQNYFSLASDQLQVERDNQALTATLNTAVTVNLPDMLGGNFTIPAMTLMFRPTAAGFVDNQVVVFPQPQYSGWTINMNHMDVPAWVRVTVPAWISTAAIETAGTIMDDATTTYISPPELTPQTF